MTRFALFILVMSLSALASADDRETLKDRNPAAQAYLDCLNGEIASKMYIDKARRGKLDDPGRILKLCKKHRAKAIRGKGGQTLERLFTRIEADLRTRTVPRSKP